MIRSHELIYCKLDKLSSLQYIQRPRRINFTLSEPCLNFEMYITNLSSDSKLSAALLIASSGNKLIACGKKNASLFLLLLEHFDF